MRPRSFDPLHLDVEVFAKEAAELEGEWPLLSLDRLADAAHPQARPNEHDTVRWHAVGEARPQRGAPPEIRLHLRGGADLSLVCQRCLGPLPTRLAAERDFVFAADETIAAELDADSEDDVLALTRSLDLRSLVEDELLLALPLVPRHELCPEPLPMAAGDADDAPEAERPNPFAALAALKRSGPAN
jgi:uncharacterized protein